MIEPEQRMLTKRPTVARTSEIGIWLSARSPTRACDPRTEITRPKDVTVDQPGKSERVCLKTMRWPLHKRLNGNGGQFVKSATIQPLELFAIGVRPRNRPENAPFRARPHRRCLKETFTIAKVACRPGGG